MAAHIQIITNNHPTYEKGDVLSACNHLTIRRSAASRVCFARGKSRQFTGLNGNGFLPHSHLLKDWHETCCEFRIERLNYSQAKMTRISDNQELIITTGVPHTDLRGKENRMMDVNIYFASHVSLFQLENAQGKAIFSDDGNNPILYGGRTKNDDTAMNTVWTAITNKTGRLEADETTYKKEPPFGSYQRNRIVVRVDDFTDDESSVLTSSLEDLTDPENPITVKKRKSWVNWENDLGLTVGEITEVKDDTKDPDLRKSEKLRSSIVRVKTI